MKTGNHNIRRLWWLVGSQINVPFQYKNRLYWGQVCGYV